MQVLTGIGELFRDGQSVAKGRYRIEHSEATAMKLGHVEGQIDLDTVTGLTLASGNPQFTLHLADGKRWDCLLQSSEGRLVNRGDGLYRPS